MRIWDKPASERGGPSSYDEPYRFGRKPTTQWPFPFTPREFARLLILRSNSEQETHPERTFHVADLPDGLWIENNNDDLGRLVSGKESTSRVSGSGESDGSQTGH